MFQLFFGEKGFAAKEIYTSIFYLGVPGSEYTRTVYSVLDYLGEVGGLFGIFSMFFSFFIGMYNSNVYSIEVVKQNYKIRPNNIKSQYKDR